MERPTRLRAFIGGYFGRSYTVELYDSAIRYRSRERDRLLSDETLEPTDQEWSEFREALDSLEVWGWCSNYSDPRTTDGTSWAFETSWGDETVSSGGSNGFPSRFESLLGAISQLLGGRVFE